jgi:hypothetical protein
MRRFVARFNFSCNLIGNRPQSLTGHTATVIGHFRTTVTTDKNNINGTTRQTKKRY